MRKSRFTEEQIILALKQHEAGRTTAEICRKLGVSEQNFYRWKAKFGGMDVADAKRLKGLEEENRKLKQLVARLVNHGPNNPWCKWPRVGMRSARMLNKRLACQLSG